MPCRWAVPAAAATGACCAPRQRAGAGDLGVGLGLASWAGGAGRSAAGRIGRERQGPGQRRGRRSPASCPGMLPRSLPRMLPGTLPKMLVERLVRAPRLALAGRRAQAAAPAGAARGRAASFAALRRIWLQGWAAAAARLPTALAPPLVRALGRVMGRAPHCPGKPPREGERAAMAACGMGRLRALARLRRGARQWSCRGAAADFAASCGARFGVRP